MIIKHLLCAGSTSAAWIKKTELDPCPQDSYSLMGKSFAKINVVVTLQCGQCGNSGLFEVVAEEKMKPPLPSKSNHGIMKL